MLVLLLLRWHLGALLVLLLLLLQLATRHLQGSRELRAVVEGKSGDLQRGGASCASCKAGAVTTAPEVPVPRRTA